MRRMKLFFVILILFGFCNVAESYMAKVGFVWPTDSPKASSTVSQAFMQGLRERGYIDGKNIIIEHRYANGQLEVMPGLINEFIDQKVDVIIATNNVMIRAAKAATKTIPIVMITSIDPVAAGYVESFARPGGNITGFAHLGRELSGKRTELLREMIPKISRVAILWDTDGPGPAVAFKEYAAAARSLNLQLQSLEVRGPAPEFEEALRIAKNARAEALIVVGNPLINQHRQRIFDLALRYRLPSMTEDSRYVRSGGLISYGANLPELYRNLAIYVDAILKGAKPGELRVKQPESFDLVVNLKTAQQLRINLPRYILVKATEVVE